MSESGSSFGDLVELQVPASSAYLTVLRTTAARLAARLGVHARRDRGSPHRRRRSRRHAAPLAVPGSNMHCSFQLHTDILDVVVSVPAGGARPTSPAATVSRTVLSALAGEVHSRVEDGRVSIMLRKKRG